MATCIEKLKEKIIQTIDDFEFPSWDCGEQSAVMVKMRAFGFINQEGVALVFESFEFTWKENFIQNALFCIANFPVERWLYHGGPIALDVGSYGTEVFPISFGNIDVKSRNKIFSVPFDRAELEEKGYLAREAEQPTGKSLALAINDAIPDEFLYSNISEIKEYFGLSNESKCIFVQDEWQHPTFGELYDDESKREEFLVDIFALAEAACKEITNPDLVGVPNSSWKLQCADPAT